MSAQHTSAWFCACIAAVSLAGGATVAGPPQRDAAPLPVCGANSKGNALYVDDPQFGEAGQRALEKLLVNVRQLMPDMPWEWHFVASDPTHDNALAEAIATYQPCLVVLANEGLWTPLAAQPLTPYFLVATDWSTQVVRDRFLATRPVNQVAFISWYAPNHAKLLELLAAMTPGELRSSAAFFDEALVDEAVQRMYEQAAREKGIAVTSFIYRDFDELQRQFTYVFGERKPDALFLPLTPVQSHHGKTVAALVASAGVPAAYTRSDQVRRGGLVAVNGPGGEIFAQLALYAVLILRGVAPSALEIGTPSRLQMTVNLNAATRIGRPVPYELLVEATEIVE